MAAMRFLLVEDDPSHARLVELVLRENRVTNEIEIAPDGETALEILTASDAASRPDLILLDVRLPRMSGLELLERIRSDEALKSIPVIILTSTDDEASAKRAYEAGVNSFLQKPIEFDRFVELVRDLGLYWTLWNRPPTSTTEAKTS